MDKGLFEQHFAPIMPVIAKAAPEIALALNAPKAIQAFLVILAALLKSNPTDYSAILHDAQKDDDLYAKLASLQCSHGGWFKLCSKDVTNLSHN